MKYFAFVSMAILALSACASAPPKIDRVQKIPTYVTIPDEILARCPEAPKVKESDLVPRLIITKSLFFLYGKRILNVVRL